MRLLPTAATALLLTLAARPAAAQVAGILNYWQQPSGNWNVPANWSLSSLPDGATDDFAVIGGTATGVGIGIGAATVNTIIAPMPGGIALGLTAANAGTLQIANGGSLTVADTAFDGNGSVNVGVAGAGTLSVDRGGSLTAVSLVSGGTAASSVTLGSVAVAGSATVNVNNAILPRTTRVIGPNVNFTAADTIDVNGGTFIAQVTSPTTHSALKAGSAAALGGTLRLEFGAGVTPTPGNSWNLFDTRNVVGSFATVDASVAPELGLGRVYAVRTQNGGVNGKLVQVAVEERLVLNVNRNSGAVSITNPGGSAIAIDGYSIASPTLGALNQANWTPIGGTWESANPTPNRLNQLTPTGSLSVAAAGAQPLGAVFAPPAPAAFGTYAEDLAFTYTQPGGGSVNGVVNFTGTGGINNLSLLVDTATGKAQLRNTSPFTINIDAYTIASVAGSLDVAQWSSLDDQNAAGGDWEEANVDANRLSELKLGGATTLAAGQLLNIGNPFNESTGRRDLTFQYLLSGEATARTGFIVYGAISLPGDFDNNGSVNVADLNQWKGDFAIDGGSDADADGDSDGADFLVWQRNLGASGATVAAAAVPEPAAWILGSLVFCGTITVRRFGTSCQQHAMSAK